MGCSGIRNVSACARILELIQTLRILIPDTQAWLGGVWWPRPRSSPEPGQFLPGSNDAYWTLRARTCRKANCSGPPRQTEPRELGDHSVKESLLSHRL